MSNEKDLGEMTDVNGKKFIVTNAEVLYCFARIVAVYVPLDFEEYKKFLSALKGK